MEQVFLILLIIGLSAILFFSSLFLSKKRTKMALIPQLTTFILTILLLILARTADGWDGLVYALFGAIILASTILSGISLLIYYFYQKSRND